jgi:hypothetical protein
MRGVSDNNPARIGRMGNNQTFDLDKTVASEHIDIRRDSGQLVITNLDLADRMLLEVPVDNGRAVGRITTPVSGVEGAYYSPRSTLSGRVKEKVADFIPWIDTYIDSLAVAGDVAISGLKRLVSEKTSDKAVIKQLDHEKSNKILERAEIYAGAYEGRFLKPETLKELGLEPKCGVSMDGAQIFFSGTYHMDEKRQAVVGYVMNADQ